MIPSDPYDADATENQNLKSADRAKDFSVTSLRQKDPRLNQIDVEEFNLLNRGLNQVDEEGQLVLAEYKRRFKKRSGAAGTESCC